MVPYSQEGLKTELEMKFGKDTRLHEFKTKKCIAMAVCRRFNDDECSEPDYLEVFDTVNPDQKHYKVVEILNASSNAPIFFINPATINGKSYIDGGIAGNNPMGMALPRTEEIFQDKKITFVLSIAPPSKSKSKIKTFGIPSLFFWSTDYLPNQLSDGNAIFLENKQKYKDSIFMRVKPTSEEACRFKLDESDVAAMETAIEHERVENPDYFQDILYVATVMMVCSMPLNPNDEKFLIEMKLLQSITKDMESREKFIECSVIANKTIEVIPKGT